MDTGKILYKFHTPSDIIGNPITYMHDDKQYVAVRIGRGGLGGHRARRRAYGRDRTPGGGRPRPLPQRLHQPGGNADRFLARIVIRVFGPAAVSRARERLFSSFVTLPSLSPRPGHSRQTCPKEPGEVTCFIVTSDAG